MRIGPSVQLALKMWAATTGCEGELRQTYSEAAALFGCNAIDGTGRRRYGTGTPSVAKRFIQTIRDDLDIFETVGMPGIDLRTSRFPYDGVKSQPVGEKPDIADVLYYVHRCAHGHGDEVQEGFELMTDGPVPGNHSMHFSNDGVRLPGSTVLGLVAVAVLAPENVNERAGDVAIPWMGGTLVVDEWWGRGDDFRELVVSGGFNYYKLHVTPPDDAENTPLSEIADRMVRAIQGG
jgi:hypothetical protein